jgi:protein-S-isoprenylcysteine O-methyltransferase
VNFGTIILLFSSLLFLTEVYRGFKLYRTDRAVSPQDKNSLRALWIVIMVTMFGTGVLAGNGWGLTDWAQPELSYIGLILMVSGFILRAWAIHQLSQFFTVNVVIHDDHQLIEHGLYAYMRHPSYTGALMMFSGLSLCYHSWLAVLLINTLIPAVFMYRIQVEEQALTLGLGDKYRAYSQRVKRLIPYVW